MLDFIKNKKKLVVGLIIIFLAIFFFEIAIKFLLQNKKVSSFSFPKPENEKKEFIEETASPSESSSSDWWVNSGGIMIVDRDKFSTNMGSLPRDSYWQKLYAKNNSRDTDGGYYPQNIFRLVTQNQWKNFSQEVYFKIIAVNMSESDYRNGSNGVLLFNRYQDGDNLYYTGLRVDGYAIIKKKIDGKYYTIKQKRVLTSPDKYDRVNNPNLIPPNQWIGIKSRLKNSSDGGINIQLFIDQKENGDWKLALEVKDRGDKYEKKPFTQKGRAGIRTDFMDVEFRNYNISEIK